MLKNHSFVLTFIFFLNIIININTQQIEIPLKLINTSFSRYPIPKIIFIKKKSLNNINFPNHLTKSFLEDSQSTLSCNIEILDSLLFAAEIEIGSNDQKFNVILDTGSQILWVPEINSNNSNTKIDNYYNPKKSKTSKNTGKEFEIYYGTGYCKGYYYQDYIKFLSNEKYNIIFGSANNSIFDVDGAEGIMGLAKTYKNYLLSPLLTLQKNGKIKDSSFSFKYDKKKEQLFFYVGKQHSDFNGKNVGFCNLLSNNNYEKMLWACQLNSFGLIKNRTNINDDDNTFAQAGISVILDTGTNVMILPYYLIYLIEEQLRKYNCVIGTSSADDFGSESSFIVCFDVYNIPDISLQFDDYILILNKYRMYFIIELGLGIVGYILNVHFQKDLSIAIIGQNFFTEFHTLFDSENKVLKFYSEYNDKIINIKKNTSNDKNNSTSSLGFLFFIIIIIIVALGFIYYRNQKKQSIENNYDWMGNNNGINSKYNNINTRNDYNAMI